MSSSKSIARFFFQHTDEQLLLLYLVRCKASLEKAKRTLEMYYISKAQNPDLFIRDPTSAEYRKWNSKVG